MPYTKRILCLASSRMPGGRCIAGKELLANGRIGGWIRLVSGRTGEGVERRYTDGTEPRVLDVMDVPVLKAHPEGYQKENWLLDPGRWKKVRRMAPNELTRFTDPVELLWTLSGPIGYNTQNEWNDRVPLSDASSFDNSLRLIKVDRLELCVFLSSNKVKGRFQHNGANYRLSVTDPMYEEQYLKKGDGTYQLGECFLIISLTAKPFDGDVYKLIAAVIEPDGGNVSWS